MKESEIVYRELEQARKECADYKRDKNWYPSVDSMLQRRCIDLYEKWKALEEAGK